MNLSTLWYIAKTRAYWMIRPKTNSLEHFKIENNSLRKQRDQYMREKHEAEEQFEKDRTILRKRIDELVESGCKYRTEQNEITYMLYDIESCLFTLGRRPEGQVRTYGGSENIAGSIDYVRDMLSANETYLRNYYKRPTK